MQIMSIIYHMFITWSHKLFFHTSCMFFTQTVWNLLACYQFSFSLDQSPTAESWYGYAWSDATSLASLMHMGLEGWSFVFEISQMQAEKINWDKRFKIISQFMNNIIIYFNYLEQNNLQILNYVNCNIIIIIILNTFFC